MRGLNGVSEQCRIFVVSFYVILDNIGVMEDFEMFEDDEFDSIFVTQSSSSDKTVSLEENSEEKVIRSDEYSDISDDEGDGLERRLR